MKAIRLLPIFAFALAFTAAAQPGVVGPSQANLVLLSDCAIVVDNVLYAPRNEPPVRSDFAFKLLTIDDEPFARERVKASSDAYAGAVVPAGFHRFKVSVAIVGQRTGPGLADEVFSATVQKGKRYFIVAGPRPGAPATLMEGHPGKSTRPS